VRASIEEVVKILDKRIGTLHTVATLVRNPHWGVARGSDSTVGQGLEPPHFLVILLDSCQGFFYT
jgi:hypothetical protein